MSKKSFFKILIAVFMTLLTAVCAYCAGTRPPCQEKIIRIAVVRGKSQITLKLKGAYEIYALGTDMEILSGRRLKKTVITPTSGGLRINDEDFKIYGFKIFTDRDGAIFINDRRFRGHVDIIRSKDLKLLVINHIDIEDYLFGVLQYEVSFWWPAAALDAQAIAARTYALYQSQINKAKEYDLTNDTFSQVYGGAGKERYRTKKAVIRTQSKVLTYDGKIFPAYYHATCGGHTEDASELWNVDLPPLKGAKCGFCEKSPHYYWESKMSLEEIEDKLNKKKYKVSGIINIEPLEKNLSGRVRTLRIRHKKGVMDIEANKLRLLLGSRLIRSANFTVEIRDGQAFFKGYGWGHGVGMCQWGAYFMSRRGYKAEEILEHYYPFAQIKNFFEISDNDETD